MTRRLTALAILATATLIGCGSDTPPATTAQVPPPAATSTPTATLTAAATATPKPKPKPKPSPTATPDAAGTPEPHSGRTDPNAALVCLRQAKVTRPGKKRARVWGGEDARTGELVLVEGPYRTVGKATAAAESLTEVSLVEHGGRYVVSAALTSGADSMVHKIATCLDR